MSSFLVVVLLIFVLISAFLFYRNTKGYLPKITVNPNGGIAPILKQMSLLNKPYTPTPWLFEKNLHTIWGMRYRGRSTMKESREDFFFKDGGQTKLDWFQLPNADENSPILVIAHTFAGGTREPCTNFLAAYTAKHGWRAVVANCRGCSGAPITSRRLFNGVETDDLETIILHIKETKKPSYIFLVGFSLGSIQAVQYIVNAPEVDAVACVSHTYNMAVGWEVFKGRLNRTLYMKTMLAKMTHILSKNKFVPEEIRKEACATTTIPAFDNAFTVKELKLNTSDEYYELTKLSTKINLIQRPLLLINSEDDPITLPSLFPENEIKASEMVASLRYPEGGHVSFLEGWNGKQSFFEPILIDFFESAVGLNKDSSK